MKISPRILWALATGVALPWSAALQAQSATPAGNPTARPNLVTVEENRPQPANGLVQEVEKMLTGGAAPEVIEAFVRNWGEQFQMSADQILHLHDMGASTPLLTAMIRRSAELDAKAAPKRPDQPVPAQPSLVVTNPASMALPNTNAAPLVVYPYPYYPLYTYSYLNPSPLIYPYYWGSPFSFSYYRGWYGSRPYSWGYQPYRHSFYPGFRNHWGSPGFPGRGPGWGGHPGWRGGPGPSHGFGRGHR